MKTPAIPHGWRKLRKGEIIQHGDKFSCNGERFCFTCNPGSLVGATGMSRYTYIRLAPQHKSHARKK